MQEHRFVEICLKEFSYFSKIIKGTIRYFVPLTVSSEFLFCEYKARLMCQAKITLAVTYQDKRAILAQVLHGHTLAVCRIAILVGIGESSI